MLRKLTVAALALAVAGGVYLAGAPAHASNMGFKLERNFRVERDPATNRAFTNIYFLSFPLFNGLDPDLANTAAIGTGGVTQPCVGDTGGPAAGDGILNADDAICDFFAARRVVPCTACIFSFQRWASDQCLAQAR